jgi:hypothetical protein
MTIQIPEGYLGTCARGGSEDATHEEYLPFDPPLPGGQYGDHILPPIEGIWHCVCDRHCDPTAKHR